MDITNYTLSINEFQTLSLQHFEKKIGKAVLSCFVGSRYRWSPFFQKRTYKNSKEKFHPQKIQKIRRFE